MEPGGLWWTNVLISALLPQRLRPDTWPEHQDPVNHTAQKKREEGREGGRESKSKRKKERKEERERKKEQERKKGRMERK